MSQQLITMKRVLMTGGSGFIGANLLRRLLYDGHEVHLLLRRQYTHWRLIGISGNVYKHFIDHPRVLSELLTLIKPNWVFNLAAYGAYSWQSDAEQMFTTNLFSTKSLIEACLDFGFESFVQIGSSSEYGIKDHAPMENEWLEPNSLYALTKALASMYCKYVAKKQLAHIPILRLYSVYGPFEDPNRLLPTVITQGLCGKLPLLADPNTARDFIYVDDVVDACIKAATTRTCEWGPIYNIGSGEQTTLAKVASVAAKAFKIKSPPVWNAYPNRIWDTFSWVSDSKKAKKELNWKPNYSFESGFQKMLEWHVNNPQIVKTNTDRA
jgi:UDP-glucose 4-epimerase